MSESIRTKIRRWSFNMFPAYRGTGGRITFISEDKREVHVRVPLNWKTRNYVGTMFGGSMYGAVDPIYMVMFIQLLGPGYTVWDKSAVIDYKKPGRTALHAKFSIDEEELDAIQRELETRSGMDRTYEVDLLDEDGNVCASIEKTLYFRRAENTAG